MKIKFCAIIYSLFAISPFFVASCSESEEEKTSVTIEHKQNLVTAVTKKNIGAVQNLLKQGVSPDVRNEKGVPIISIAASSGSIKIVRALIDAGADVNALDSDEKSPLQYAIDNGKVKITGILKQAGATLTKLEKLALSVDFGEAAEKGDYKKVEAYLQVIDPQGKEHSHPSELITIFFTAKKGNAKVVKAIVEYKRGNGLMSDEDLDVAFFTAVESGDVEIVKVLEDVGGELTSQHLERAIDSMQWEVARYIVKRGVDINSPISDDDNLTPLEVMIIRRQPEQVKGAIELGADVNKESEHGSPLFRAVGHGNVETIKVLIDAGADLNAKHEFNRTPLNWAIANGNLEVVKVLMEAGAKSPYTPSNEEYETSDAFTDLIYNCKAGEHMRVKAAILAGVPVNGVDFSGRGPLVVAAHHGKIECVKALLEAGADINMECATSTDLSWKISPLMASVENLEIMKLLISKGARVNQHEPELGYTALHIASLHGNHLSVEELLKAGANINAKNALNYTPLMKAAEEGNLKTVQVLLSHGANIKAKDIDGETALSKARKKGHHDVIEAIRNASK